MVDASESERFLFIYASLALSHMHNKRRTHESGGKATRTRSVCLLLLVKQTGMKLNKKAKWRDKEIRNLAPEPFLNMKCVRNVIFARLVC